MQRKHKVLGAPCKAPPQAFLLPCKAPLNFVFMFDFRSLQCPRVSCERFLSVLMETRGNPVENRGNPVETRGNPWKPRGNPWKPRGNPVETRGNPVETRGNPVENRGNPVETRGNPEGPQRYLLALKIPRQRQI